MKKTLLGLIIISSFLSAQQKEHRFFEPSAGNYGLVCRVIDQRDGLPSNFIKKFFLDKKGFLWILTDEGIARWDGGHFKIINGENYPEFSGYSFQNICEDKNGGIWINTEPENIFRLIDGVINHVADLKKLSGKIVSRIVSDEQGNLWIGTLNSGLFKYDGSKLTSYYASHGLNEKSISRIILDSQNKLLIGTNGGGLFRQSGQGFKKVYSWNENSSKRIIVMFEDSLHMLWLGTNRGITILKNFKPVNIPLLNKLSRDLILSIDQDKDGNIWIATYNRGIFVYTGNKLFRFTTANGLSDIELTKLKVIGDAVWVGTINGGINQIKRATVNIISKANGLNVDFINCVYQDIDGSLLVGTLKGIFRIKDLHHPSAVKLNILANNHIYAIRRDRAGQLIVGTRLFGLYIFDKNKVKNYSIENGLTVNFVRAVFIDEDGSVWIGTNGGGVCILKNGKFKYLSAKNGLSNNLISFIHKSREGKYWIGTSGGGVNILDKSGGIKILDKEHGLKGNVVSSIYEAANDDIWLTVNGGGVSKIFKGGIFNFTAADGMFTDKVLNIIPDNKNRYWFPTRKGIFSVDVSQFRDFQSGKISGLTCSNYGISDGMLNDRCTGSSPQTAVRTAEGNLYFSTYKGVAEIDPGTITEGKKDIKMVIDDKIVDSKKYSARQLLHIPPNHNRVEIGYDAISFNHPENIVYKYMLKGLDNDWLEGRRAGKAVYTHLAYGNYTFKVFAKDKYDNIKSSVAQLNIYVEPYFWETLWFRWGSILLLSILLVIATRYYLSVKFNRKLKMIEAERALENERIRISNDMHDELGASVTKMSLLSELAKRNSDNPEYIKENLRQISDMGHSLASTMDEIVWAVNPKNDRLDKLIYYTVQYVEDYLSLAGIEVMLDIPEEMPDKFISAEVRHNIFLVIKEAVNNIVKHSGADKAKLSVLLTEKDKISFSLSDNGKGIDFDKIDKFRNGLQNMRKRIENLNGFFEMKNLEDMGISIHFSLNI